MKKKVLAFLLCSAMAMSSLAGCGSADTTTTGTAASGAASGDAASAASSGAADASASKSQGDMDTLALYIPSLATYSEDAITEVQNAISDYTASKYGFKVSLHYTEIGNFEKAINLGMTTDEVDVTCYFNGSGQLSNYVSNGQLLDITDYFSKASDDLKNTFTDAEIQASSINGRMYGLVRKYQYGGKESVVMNKDIVSKMGIDPTTINSMDALGEVLYKVHQQYPDVYAMVPQSSADMTWCTPWVGGIGLTNFAYAEDTESTQAKSLFELDSFAKFCSYTHKWYQDGLIMSDAISNTMEGSDLVSSGKAFCCLHNGDIDPLDKIYPNTVESATVIAPKAIPTDIGNLQYGISANSAHPDESFTLLQALYTDPDLATLLAYGIKGEHYQILADGRADFPDGITANNDPYGGFSATAVYPDFLIIPVKESATYQDAKKTVEDWDASVKVSKAFGYQFDTTKDTDFVTAYTNIENKYKNALMTGSISLDDTLPSIQSELKSIGFYDKLAEVQTGLDKYLSENK